MLSVELQDKQNTFNQKYGVNFDVEKMQSDALKFALLDEALIDKINDDVAKAENYFNFMRKMLLNSLDAKTKVSAEGKYNLDDFDFADFINEFEEIVSQNNAESKNPQPRKPFENMKYEDLIERVKGVAQPYNQSVYGIWAAKIINQKIKFTYENLQAVTNGAINAIETSITNADASFARTNLINIVYAKEAMAQVRASRTGWWKFWHMYDNYKERKYYESLVNKVEEYTEKGFSVGKIMEEAPQELLKNAYKKTASQEERELDATLQRIQEAEAKKNSVIGVREKMEAVIAKPETTNEIVSDIMKALPKSVLAENVQKTMLINHIVPEMITKVQECNREFDKVIVSRTMTPNVQMLYFVESMFEKAFPMPVTLGYSEDKDIIVAAQVITDAVLKKLSPVALNPEELGVFANGYVVNNPNAYVNITGIAETDTPMIEAKNAFNGIDSDKVEVFEAITENNAPIVQPVQNDAPSIQSPNLRNK